MRLGPLLLAPLLACAAQPVTPAEAPEPPSAAEPALDDAAPTDPDPDGLGAVDTDPGPPVISFEDDDDAGPAEHIEGARPTPDMPSFEIMGMNAGDGPG